MVSPALTDQREASATGADPAGALWASRRDLNLPQHHGGLGPLQMRQFHKVELDHCCCGKTVGGRYRKFTFNFYFKF